jgi:dolichol-phosphate mannosyltransferase
VTEPQPNGPRGDLKLFSIVVPARDEEGCIASTIEHLHLELRAKNVQHEIVVVDDGSTDRTWEVLQQLGAKISELVPVRNEGQHGYGRAVVFGIERAHGDAVCIMMADESDDCRDAVRYWEVLQSGYDCVFGSRFIKGSAVVDYPWFKLRVNRLANWILARMFRVKCNDLTNAFKAYRREALDGCQPFLSPHFNLTIELPLKAIVRGYSWKVVPITWRNRKTGESKLKLKEMGSRYFFIMMYCWLEKYFTLGDYRRVERAQAAPARTDAVSNSGLARER